MMRAALACFNQGRGSRRKPVIKIGCGLNSGSVVAGQIGSSEHLEFTIIGDAVSLADRTETFNKPFGTEILITENTWRLAGDHIITEEMPPVIEKGRKIRMFAVVNIRGEGAEALLADLGRVPKTDPAVCRRVIGSEGPGTLAELRRLLDIPAPDLSMVNTGEEEKKYKVSKK
jgi:adenylate cyclase